MEPSKRRDWSEFGECETHSGEVLAKHMVISGVFLVTFWGPKNDDQWGDRQEGFPPAALGDLDDRQDDLGCPGTSSEDVWYRVKLQAEFL